LCSRAKYSSGLELSDKPLKRRRHHQYSPCTTLADINQILAGVAHNMLEVASEVLYNDAAALLKLSGHMGYTAPLELTHCHVTVKQSERHGLGVFATRQLPCGVVATFYPAHILFGSTEDSGRHHLLSETHEAILCYDRGSCFLNVYTVFLSKDTGTRLVGHPALRDDPRLLGHMLNDPVGNIFAGISPEQLRAMGRGGALAHAMPSYLQANCAFCCDAQGIVVTVVTTRDIEAGEELLVAYDPCYWLAIEYGARWDTQHPFMRDWFAPDFGSKKFSTGTELALLL
jgi:hypothetical protein